jgi:1,4-dihydroxy-6-naphthoate synthase
MDAAVCQQHIDLCVNEFTQDLGPAGYDAVEALLSQAASAGLVPPLAGDLKPVGGRP